MPKMERPCATFSCTKSSNVVCSNASFATVSAKCCRDHHDAFVIANQDVTGVDRDLAARDRHVEIHGVMPDQVRRRSGAA